MSGLADPLETLSSAIAGVLRNQFTLMLSERQSHLGQDIHIRAVLRRIACGEPGAVILDAHYLLTLEAHNEEQALLLRAKKPPSAPPTGGARA